MRQYTLSLAIIFLCVFGSIAQQRPVYSNFMLNNHYYNPAIAGSKNVHIANLSYRNRWVGFDGAPSIILGNIHGSLKNQGKIGYGATVISERTGITQNTSVYLNYAQHFKLSEEVKLGLGIQPGYVQYRVRLYEAQLADEGDNVLTGNVYAANALDLNTGFHLYSKKFFVMGSIQRMLGKAIKFTSYNQNLAFHYTAIAGYNFLFNQDAKKKKKPIELQPSVMINYVKPTPVQVTAMLKGTFDNKFWAGLMYRSNDAVGVMLGMNIKERLNIGYAYDYTLSRLSNYQVGSHEISLSFILTRDKPSLSEKDDELNNSILDDLNKQIEEKRKEEKRNKTN